MASQPTAVASPPSRGHFTVGAALPVWSPVALILVVTCVAYWPALTGGMLWDDDMHVTRTELRTGEGLYRIWFDLPRANPSPPPDWTTGATQQYYPLLHSFFWLQWQLWDDHPLGYHLVNLALHLAAVCLVYAVLRRLSVPGALLAAALFAVHPVQTETVAWITEQKNTLSAIFYLGAMWAYLQFDDTRGRFWFGLSLGLFVLGLLSKTVTATLPAALLVVFWWQRGRITWRDVRPLLPFFVLGALAGLFTAWVEQKALGAEGSHYDLALLDRVVLAGRIIWFYLGKLIWPANLTFIYPRWQIDASAARQWIFPLSALALLIVLWAIRGRCRGPLAGYLFFVGTLFPVLGFLNVFPFQFSYVADHFQYLACLGIFAVAAGSVGVGIEGLSSSARSAAIGACAALVCSLAALSWNQSFVYRDAATLYRMTLDRNPDCWMAINNLAELSIQTDPPDEVMARFEEALRLQPNFPQAHVNLGVVLERMQRPRDAIAHYEEALRIKPGSVAAHFNLGNALATVGETQPAIAHFQRAVQLRPDFGAAHYNLANVLMTAGQTSEAIDHYQQALRIEPEFVDGSYKLAAVLFSAGRRDEALEQFQQIVARQPDFAPARFNLGTALLAMGRPQEAAQEFERTTQLNPEMAEAWKSLAMARAQAKDAAGAAAAANKALSLARAQGQNELAQELETWLKANSGNCDPRPETPAPSPTLPPRGP